MKACLTKYGKSKISSIIYYMMIFRGFLLSATYKITLPTRPLLSTCIGLEEIYTASVISIL
ncbi:MAG: hypothetical protein IPK35_20185 [Saprospiraceae bacterium]|nr:hypothetical protein [Saprospiraceae bacterium]